MLFDNSIIRDKRPDEKGSFTKVFETEIKIPGKSESEAIGFHCPECGAKMSKNDFTCWKCGNSF